MYEKAIKFKLETKFFNNNQYLENKYIYDWLSLSRKYFLDSLRIDLNILYDLGFYYADNEIKISINKNLKYVSKELEIYTSLEKHNGVKTIFKYKMFVDGELILTATSSHSILSFDSDRSVRIDRYLPKWDKILKDVVNNEI